ncbi:MAG: glycosyltransferase family 39 protein [Chitinophagales bacterium]|nr:glycosyltransferase family 39 protein [Chitinophagales bacterium]
MMKNILYSLSNPSLSAQKVFLLYFLFACIFFLQLPLHSSLPGNWDSWLYLYLFNYYPEYIRNCLSGAGTYQAFFPETLPPFIFGEPSFFNALLYLPIQWVVRSPIWSFYLFISLVMSLNALGIFLIIKKLKNNSFIAFVSGLLLMFSNYMMSSLDQSNVLSIYPSLFTIYYLLLFHQNQAKKFLYIACLCAAIQIYCSGYHFLFLGVTIALLLLLNARTYLLNKQRFIQLVTASVFLLILISPFLFLYIFSYSAETTVNSVNDEVLKSISLHFKDFLQSHPYNLIYGDGQDKTILYYLHSALPGVSVVILTFLGFLKSENRWIYIILLIPFLLIALGPDLYFVKNPVYILMHYFSLDQFMRTPVRAYIVILLILILLSVEILPSLLKKSPYLFLLLLGLYLVENVPYRLQYFESSRYTQAPEKLMTFTNSLKDDEVLWIQPSKLYDIKEPVGAGLGQVNREYIYMYWQTKFKKNMVNGMNGYVPRVNADLRIKNKDIDSIVQNGQSFKVKRIYLEEMEY